LFDDFLALVDAPTPEPDVLPYFYSRRVVAGLAKKLDYPYSDAVQEAIASIAPYEGRPRMQTSYRVRILNPLGLYPKSSRM
jgi:hypothetical protein